MTGSPDGPCSSTEGASQAPLDRTAVGAQVRAFYELQPFNAYATDASAAEHVRPDVVAASYPDLDALLRSGRVSTVLEIGCGAGWLANSLALHHDVRVTAVDFTPHAIVRARGLAKTLGQSDRVTFVAGDLFAFDTEERFDLVVSLGVLHHTGDARGAFAHVQRFARPGGRVYVGLYHLYGRRPFLELFRQVLERDGEEAAWRRYRQLDGVRRGDEEHMRSWFRDQVLHPHETQHTLREVADWCAADGLEVVSTSINRFAPLDDIDAVCALEPGYEQRSHQANVVEGRYLPGFFVVMARRS